MTNRPDVDPLELLAGVITGWFWSWAMLTFGIDKVPALTLGIIIGSATFGRLRSRWRHVPRPEPRPDDPA